MEKKEKEPEKVLTIDEAEEAKAAARKAEKSRRMLEKAMRVPLNDTVLQIQDGVIDIKDLFHRILMKVKEAKKNG